MNNENGLTPSQLAERNATLVTEIEKCCELSGCPAGVDLQDWVKQLAAENVGLKNVFIQKEIPSEAVDAFMETAVMDHDWNETSEWSWVENETEVIHAVLDALKPETTATDRIVAGIKADTANQMCVAFVKHKELAGLSDDDVVTVREATDAVLHCAEVISEGADK
ncbi:hypothetical protein ACSSQJ_002948 [Klebsiella aerogenes]